IRGYRHREPPVRNRGDSKEMSSVVSPLPNAAAASRVSQAMTEAVYIFPPSFGQQQLWLLDRLLPDGSVFNVPAILRMIAALEIDALREALRELVRRHEVLRTRFEVQHAMPVQVIAPELKLGLEVEDLGALPEEEREAEAQRRAKEVASKPFDLERGPLLRARLLR